MRKSLARDDLIAVKGAARLCELRDFFCRRVSNSAVGSHSDPQCMWTLNYEIALKTADQSALVVWTRNLDHEPGLREIR